MLQRREGSSAATGDLIRQIDHLGLDIKASMGERAVGSSHILESIMRINEISGTSQAGLAVDRNEGRIGNLEQEIERFIVRMLQP